jgi:hypothetical protein
MANEKEIKDLEIRRKHEKQVFFSLNQRNLEISKSDKNYKDVSFYAIDTTWFNKWKVFVSNDLTDKILPNDKKYISDNKKIGVLPPDIIDNSKICVINNVKNHDSYNGEIYKYKLKKGLKPKKDYIIINQYLWEWLLVNYSGGPEIKINKKQNPSILAPINEKNEINHYGKIVDENNINKNNIINKKNSFQNIKNKTKIINNNINNKNNNTINYTTKNNLQIHNHNSNKKKSTNNIQPPKKVRKTITFNNEESNNNSSNLASSDEEKSKSMSLDKSSNKINQVNRYTFNTKFCDFNNNHKQTKNNNRECFEDVELFVDKNYS